MKSFLGIVGLCGLLIYSVVQVHAAGIGFNYEHNFANPNVGTSEPVGELSYGVDIPDSVNPGQTVAIAFNGTAIEPLAHLPICPTFRYGISSSPQLSAAAPYLSFNPSCFANKNLFVSGVSPMYFTAPSTPGTYYFCGQAGMNDLYYVAVGGVQCMQFAVVGPPPIGSINISSSVPASWTITGPTMYSGSGTGQSYGSAPAGTYTITWGSVPGYTTPPTQSLTLTSGATINFSAVYGSLASCPRTVIHPGCQVEIATHGGSSGLCAAGYTGTCSYTCSNGTWTRVMNDCRIPASVNVFFAN